MNEIDEHMQRNQLLNIILEDTLAGFWDWNIPANEEYLSPTFKKMFGYEDHELENSPETWQKLIFEDDLGIVLKNFEDHVKTKGEIPYDNIVRYRHKNGSTVHVICKGNVIEWGDDGSPIRMVGSHVDITKIVNAEQELVENNKRFNLIMDGINAGIWDWDVETGKEWWSDRFYELLDYKINEIPATFDTFLNVLLHPDDKSKVDEAVKKHFEDKIPYKLEIRLKTKQEKYLWFETSGKANFNAEGKPVRMAGSIVNINDRRKTQEQLTQTNEMAKVGGWEADLITQKVFWTKEVYDIHELPYDTEITIENSIDNFVPKYVPILQNAISNTIKTLEPYDIELKLFTATKKQIWVRAIGKPVLNPGGEVIGLQGVFQDINTQKEKEGHLTKSINVITEQNNRLRNFAHIVSHNLRTHTGNFELMLEMYKNEDEEAEKETILEHLTNISANLSDTIKHLNEVVTINTSTEIKKAELNLQEYLNNTIALLDTDIKSTNAKITGNFVGWKTFQFVPAYLDSILLNFITNAIKYKHPDKDPELEISTKVENGKKILSFSDNGSGIDLKKHGEKLFGMYKTFHKNKNSRGIGLFITKNQIESLGGKIEVESEVGKGTTFKITFK